MKESMSKIERVRRALNFQEVDRVPIVGGFVRHPEFLAEVSEEPDFWANPRKVAVKAYQKLGVDAMLSVILPKDRKTTADGIHGRPTDFSLPSGERDKYRSPEDVVAYIERLPSLSDMRKNFNFDKVYTEYINHMRNGQREMEDMLWFGGMGYGSCGFMWYTQFGYENYFTAMLLYKESLRKLFEFSGESGRLRNQAIAKAIRDENLWPFVWFGEDICNAEGPMVSPELLDEIYFPYLKRAIEPLKDAGIKIIQHFDGNGALIVDRLIDIGIDGFQGFYEDAEAGVDLLARLSLMRAKSGEKLLLIGSISTTTTLPFGTVEDVKKDVERCIQIAEERGGGLLLNASSSIGPEVPKENLYAMFEHAMTYRSSKNWRQTL